MLVYRFKPSDRANHKVALTGDEQGANRPTDGAPWVAFGSGELATTKPLINASMPDFEMAIRSKGFYLWSIAVPEMKRKFSA